MDGWTIVVPVRRPRTGKTRLGASPQLAEALARDTLASVRDSEVVDRIILVTDDASWAQDLTGLHGLQVEVQTNPGLDGAVADGLAVAGSRHVAVLLGDLPALRPSDLTAALVAAGGLERGLVADRPGNGTTLITALRGSDHSPRFGVESAARHRRAGYRDLAVPPGSTLRCDVDTASDLLVAMDLGVGPRTRAVIGR